MRINSTLYLQVRLKKLIILFISVFLLNCGKDNSSKEKETTVAGEKKNEKKAI